MWCTRAPCLPLCETACSPEAVLGPLVTAPLPACLSWMIFAVSIHQINLLCALSMVLLSFLSRVKGKRDHLGSIDQGLGELGEGLVGSISVSFKKCWPHSLMLQRLPLGGLRKPYIPVGLRPTVLDCPRPVSYQEVFLALQLVKPSPHPSKH